MKLEAISSSPIPISLILSLPGNANQSRFDMHADIPKTDVSFLSNFLPPPHPQKIRYDNKRYTAQVFLWVCTAHGEAYAAAVLYPASSN